MRKLMVGKPRRSRQDIWQKNEKDREPEA